MSSIVRQDEVDALLDSIQGARCASVVGLSNIGKSTLLRHLAADDIHERYTAHTGRRVAFVYVDCNRMIELSGQGFYELVLRCLRESLHDLDAQLTAQLNNYYREVVEPDTPFLVPLNFNHAMTAIIEGDQRDIVLLLDEFDEALDALDGRVFLNLRAMKDKYPRNLIYVTATIRRLGARRVDEQTAEFVELSAADTHILAPLTRDNSREIAHSLAVQTGLQTNLTDEEFAFLDDLSGGHPRLLRIATSHLLDMKLHEPEAYEIEGLARVQSQLVSDITVRSECSRLWGQLTPDERDTLLEVASGAGLSELTVPARALLLWGLLVEQDDGGLAVFSRLFEEHIQHQAAIQRNLPSGVWVDEDSGDVWIDGMPAPPLTDLEYRLLALLHSRLDKMTDKYQIVEAVWGVQYIEEVDDSRIEKLVSRVRAKIEPNPGEPRYLITVRGRGYRLTTS